MTYILNNKHHKIVFYLHTKSEDFTFKQNAECIFFLVLYLYFSEAISSRRMCGMCNYIKRKYICTFENSTWTRN